MRLGLLFLLLAGCAAPAPPPKPSSAKPRPNGEQQLRQSLAHTKSQPRRK